ncbi:unnamed protein product [Allacma fusca]|uniref:Uncharacterized protein n=1 Tax=Allacma fusca TaxID=39272 RepID=A0A8J2P5X3_9HEXA|nr:unnamed protein product [Allacma fusca]
MTGNLYCDVIVHVYPVYDTKMRNPENILKAGMLKYRNIKCSQAEYFSWVERETRSPEEVKNYPYFINPDDHCEEKKKIQGLTSGHCHHQQESTIEDHVLHLTQLIIKLTVIISFVVPPVHLS